MTKTQDEIHQAITESSSLREAARRLGTNHVALRRYATEHGIDTGHFTHGKSYESMVGKKYEMLTVLEIRKRPYHRKGRKGNCFRPFAYCQCDCGGLKEMRADELKDGRYVSCGCHSHNRWNTVADKNHAFKGKGELRSRHFGEIKRNAARRHLAFDLTLEQAWTLYENQDGTCALTGCPITFGRVYYPNETTASLDRVDNTLGYAAENTQWVLKDINMMKGSLDNEYFIKLCNLVAKKCPRDV